MGNEADADRVALFGLTNEIDASTGDGWARIAYGEWPHEQGVQRFGKAQAEEMVGYFKNTWNRIKRAVVGMPIFRGHPDLKAVANEFPDKAVYGAIADMEARDDGLYIRPILSEAGAALVNEQGLKFFSPHWLARKLPPENGRPVFAPAFMVSIGLTARPNIAGTSLVNSAPVGAHEKQNQSEITTMPKWLLELLGLANEATEDQVKTKVADLLKRPEPTALANEQTARTSAEGQLVEAKTKLSDAETALANERTALAAARKERNEAVVSAAIAAGRIAEASKPVWLGRLDRDYATESVALANEKVVKTQPRTAGLGERKVVNVARDQFTALVNEALPKHAGNWEQAWHAVKATAQGKALFDQIDAAPAK